MMNIPGSLRSGFKNISLKENIYTALALRLLIVMLLFSVCRVAFYLFNTSLFPDMNIPKFLRIMAGGLKFDVSAVLYVNAVFILLNIIPFKYRNSRFHQKVLKYIFALTNSVALAANCVDLIYYRFILKRTTSNVFETFAHEQILGKLFFRFIMDFWYVYLFWGVMVYIMMYLYGKVKIAKPAACSNLLFYPGSVVMLVLISGLFVAGCRGGFLHSTRPITLSNAGEYVDRPDEMSIVLNTPFSMIRTINKKPLQRVDYFSSGDALNAVYDPHYKAAVGGKMKNENIVIIILESFGQENSALLNPGLRDINPEGYTPFLDSLMKQSRTYRNAFANGLKSIDSLPSILASIPSLQNPYVLSHHSHNRMNSIAGLLAARGYATLYFHGAPDGSMGFQSFVHLAGFEKYYGKTEYGNDADYDGIWGVWDEEFFQFFANTLNKEKQPFCAAISSVSSHHPFKVPQRYEGKFKDGPVPLNKAISYTDYALEQFFETASKMPWYENTLFVITADHASYNFQDFKNSRGNFAVPLIFFKPGSELKGFDETIVQQIDIMPTVLNYLNFDGDYIAFGNNAFDGSADHFAVNYTADTYQIFMSDYLLQFRDEKVVGYYNFRNDRLLKNNITDGLPDVRKQLETKLRAFIQQYNNRMLDNDITVRGPEAIASKAE